MMYVHASGRNFILDTIYPEFNLVRGFMLQQRVSVCVLGAAVDEEGEIYCAKSVGKIVLTDQVLRHITTKWRELGQEFPRTCDMQ